MSGEQIEFLRGHFGETIEPQAGNPESGIRNPDFGTERVPWQNSKGRRRPAIRVGPARACRLPATGPGHGVCPGSSRRSAKRAASARSLAGRELMLLQFTEQLAELLREPRPPGAAPEQFQFVFMPQDQRAQHHDAALVVQLVGRRHRQLFQNKSRQPVERKNMQPRVAGTTPSPASNWRSSWNVACLGASRTSGGPSGHCLQRGADFGKAAERLAAAGGTEEKARLHAGFFAQSPAAQSNLLGSGCIFCIIFFISFRADLIMLAARWKNSNSIQRRNKAKSYATDTH